MCLFMIFIVLTRTVMDNLAAKTGYYLYLIYTETVSLCGYNHKNPLPPAK